jgi:hypothetical protein
LVTCVEHRAATYPTLDPTWYSPITIVLSDLEVDVASICASAPVFWPVLCQKVLTIFVTKEVEVTRMSRDLEGAYQLQGNLGGHSQSRNGSQVGLRDEMDIEKGEVKRMTFKERPPPTLENSTYDLGLPNRDTCNTSNVKSIGNKSKSKR